MKKRLTFMCGIVSLMLASGIVAHGQGVNKFVKKTMKQYWLDQNRQPWSDTSFDMAVRIDPEFAAPLGVVEIASDDIDPLTNQPFTYSVGEWKFFKLRKDGVGTYAEVDYLVYENKYEPVVYQVELQKNNRSIPFAFGSSQVEVFNDTPNIPPIGLKQNNPILLKDWLIIAGVLILGAILLYVLVLRALFSGLLFKRRWGVASAEHFTWSLALLVMLGIASLLTLLYLRPRLETYIIIGAMGALWLLHAIVWLVSGKEA